MPTVRNNVREKLIINLYGRAPVHRHHEHGDDGYADDEDMYINKERQSPFEAFPHPFRTGQSPIDGVSSRGQPDSTLPFKLSMRSTMMMVASNDGWAGKLRSGARLGRLEEKVHRHQVHRSLHSDRTRDWLSPRCACV